MTVWMLTAHGMDSRMTGLIQRGGFTSSRSARRVMKRDQGVQHQVAAERDHVPEHHGMRRGIEHHVEHASGLPHVHEDEQHAHMTAAMARNSPRMVMRPNALQSCR